MIKKRQQAIKLTITLAAIIVVTAVITPLKPAVFAQSASANSNTSTGYNSVKTLRIGYFPNINHAQAVIGFGNGDFQKALGNNINVQTTVFNAGPSAIEALLAKRIDATYVGPNPAINGYVVSDGKDLKIIAGSSSGGASFVVRNDAGINSPKDLAGKRLASPELGNTQDIALRSYLLINGLKTTDQGGNIVLTPIANPDILTLFLKKQLDGAWVPEPWATRLVKEANGRIFLDERSIWPGGKFVTANIAVSTDYLKNNLDITSKLLSAHVNETVWINNHKDEAVQDFNTQVKKLTGKSIPQDELKQAFSMIDFTYDPLKLSLFQSANNAYNLGLLAKGKPHPDLSGIFDLTILDQVLKSKGLAPIEQLQSQQSSSSSGGNLGAAE
ncbi:MAG TPA: ABC transporter substrate-binding protein [Nitrososphaeraceae archaeon]|nr:ABC transporter substrate-binding protein [Nitrososphaeraceae archaeon]